MLRNYLSLIHYSDKKRVPLFFKNFTFLFNSVAITYEVTPSSDIAKSGPGRTHVHPKLVTKKNPRDICYIQGAKGGRMSKIC